MGWVVVALGAAAVGGAVSILDKVLLRRFVRSHVTFQLMVGAVQGALGAVILLATGLPEDGPRDAVILALTSGVLWGAGALVLFRVLRAHEVSRTIPVYQTFPVYAALMGLVFLGETLSAQQWGAVFLTVSGAVLLSVDRGAGFRGLIVHRALYLLSAGAVIAAAAHIAGSAAVSELPVMTVHGIRSLGMAGLLLLASLRPHALAEVRSLISARSAAVPLVLLNETLASVGLGLIVWALALGPVALVTAITTTRSFFVLAYSVALGFAFRDLLGEDVRAWAVAIKVLSVGLVVAGLILMTLG